MSTGNAEAVASSNAANTTTKDELLIRAKAAIEAGERSLHAAAEALGIAHEDHFASQREMAEAIGKSASWVNKLLKWRRAGYKDPSPFGPTTKKGRVEHAQQHIKPRKHDASPAITQTDDAAASAEMRKAEYEKLAADATTSTDGGTSTSKDARASAHALDEFKYAVNAYVPKMDDAAKREAAAYFHRKAGVAVS